MVILYGYGNRDLEMGSGTFDCPNCRKRTYCQRRKIEEWFHVYFIPVFPGEYRAVYRKCADCHRSFNEAGLPMFPAGGALRSDMLAELRAGGPIEGVYCLLIVSGIDMPTAASVILELAGRNHNSCLACSLSYLESVENCKRCGAFLTKGCKKSDPFDDFA